MDLSLRRSIGEARMAVGIFDSGLGGLTVYQAVAERLPNVPVVYYGDNANTPYGVRDDDDIYEMTTRGVSRLFEAGCDLVILACNTASAAALRRMQESWVPKQTQTHPTPVCFRAPNFPASGARPQPMRCCRPE